MKCEWCAKRDAVLAGKPHVGPESRMCALCAERVCRRDPAGAMVCEPIEEYLKRDPKGLKT